MHMEHLKVIRDNHLRLACKHFNLFLFFTQKKKRKKVILSFNSQLILKDNVFVCFFFFLRFNKSLKRKANVGYIDLHAHLQF